MSLVISTEKSRVRVADAQQAQQQALRELHPKKQSRLKILFMTTRGLYEADRSVAMAQKLLEIMEHIASPADYRYPQVHAEVILDDTAYSAVGQPPGPCVLSYPAHLDTLSSLPFIETVDVPITDPEAARRFLVKTTFTPATYSIPYADFVLPSFVLRYTDPDLDHSRPFTWSHLYCSQFALLFLRHCASEGIIPLPPDALRAHLYSVSSHACSPAHLAHLLDNLLASSC